MKDRLNWLVKSPLLAMTAALAALVFASCLSYPLKMDILASSKYYWDEDLPQEESIELFLHKGMTVTSYNGIPVEWEGRCLVFLPPGETFFTLGLNKFAVGNTLFSGSSVFAWNFKAGDRFILQGGYRDDKPGVVVWDMNVKKKMDEYDFFPFPESSGRTVLD